MKKAYETPVAEKVTFQYQEQVTASGVNNCADQWINIGAGACQDNNWVKNLND